MDTTETGPPITGRTVGPKRHSSATQLAGTATGALRGSIGTEGKPGMDLEKIAAGVRLILEGIGENPDREGLLATPARVARMYGELLYGLHEEPAAEISCTFTAESELILVCDISFSAMCEHHMVPFIGVAHVGYIPRDGKITGLSKLARVVELVSRRLQVQERMTTQIADAIADKLQPEGVIVVVEAEHLCMSIRGIRKPGSKTITSAIRGCFRDPATRAEAMALIQGRHA
jgi:GTP cyclohydrolase IA